ncbi:MAG TPA: glycosyltransferase family protein, partial [Schlesneria sp.]
MARIFYSMAGEGRGHAVRVRTLVEHLRHEHELVLFAPDEAYDFLVKSYGDDCAVENVRLLRIPGIKFHYTGGKLDLLKSIGHGLNYARRELPTLVNAFCRRIDAEQPDLCISDFEPSLPRAARKMGVPLMSIDHQHVLLAYDLKTLPLLLRRYAWWMSWSIRYYYGSGPYQAVTSSFYTPPLKAGFENVQQVGPMLREDLVATVPQQGDFLLSYLRMNTPPRVLETLAACDWDVRVYGLGELPRQGRITFHAIDEQRFVNDLANCAALVSAAGNQLLGEALYLGKPVFAIPEEMHH